MPETNFDFSVLETIPDTDAEIEVPEEVLEGPQTEEEQGVASLILDAISNSANTIQMYNAIIANCTDEEIVDSLNEILVDENRIMGKLQSILQKVSPNAEEIMNGAIEDSGLDESFTGVTNLNGLTNIIVDILNNSDELEDCDINSIGKSFRITVNGIRYEYTPTNLSKVDESLNESIAIKKNSTWIDTVGNDLCKVVDIKEVEREKRNVLGSFKDTDIIVQYDDSPRKFTFSKGEFLVRFVPFRKSYRESINEDLLYANNIDKEILDGAGDKNIRPITTGTREKCSISAINNLKALLSKGESASLCLGQMKLKDEAPNPNSWISHVWVKSENGDILETNVHNIDFNSREHYCVKEIKFDPKDFENIGYFYNKLESELGGKSVNESLLESSIENIDQFIRNYLEHHPFDSAEEMIDYLEDCGEIEELEDRFHTDVEAAIEDYFEYLNESLILDESNNLDTSLDDITPVRDEHNERAIRDHKKYKEDRKKAFKEISKNAKDAFELDESLFESFYLNYEDSDLLQDWDQGGLDFSVDIYPYKYEFYTSRDANKALKIAISHGYKDSWREGRYVYLTAH